MSRYCEIRIVDVLASNIDKITKEKNKYQMDYKSLPSRNTNKIINSKNKIDNVSAFTKREIGNKFVTGVCPNAVERETRSSRRVAKDTSSQSTKCIYQNVEFNDSEAQENSPSKKNITCLAKEINAVKRKRQFLTGERNDAPLVKKTCNVKHLPPVISNQNDKSNKMITQSKKNKRKKSKNRKKFWENKLTGARRVSKRLSNLKIRNKILEEIEPCIDPHQVLIKKRKAVDFSAKKEINTAQVLHNQYQRIKGSKSVKKRNRSELQSNFGKLSHTRKLYPRISSSRSTNCRLKRKTIGSVLNNKNVFIEENISSYEPDPKQFIGKEVDVVTENLTTVSSNEGIKNSEDSKNIQELVETDTSKVENKTTEDELKNNEDITSKIEGSTNEITLDSELILNVQEESDQTAASVVIIDIESSENIICEKSEHPTVSSHNTDSVDSTQKEEKETEPEKLAYLENSKTVKPVSIEEKSDSKEINSVTTELKSVEIKNTPLTLDKENKSTVNNTTTTVINEVEIEDITKLETSSASEEVIIITETIVERSGP